MPPTENSQPPPAFDDDGEPIPAAAADGRNDLDEQQPEHDRKNPALVDDPDPDEAD